MTSKGQVTIPATIRRNLGLNAGESVRFKVDNNSQVVIEKNDWKRGLNELHKEVAAHLKKHNIKPLTDEELDDAINEAAQQAATERYQRSLEQ
jgi:AbrB family looped-hinge helix DNA binding protein